MLFDNEVALVTGGASGIGRSAALIFAREGARVVVSDISAAAGHETVAMITAAGGDSVFIAADMRNAGDIDAMVSGAVEHFGRLDCAFNNAGHEGGCTSVVDCTDDEWEMVMAVNLTAVWRCMRREIPHMVKQGGGAIVNTSSGLGLAAMPNMAAYVTSKHAVVGLTRAAALDFGAQNVRVNVLHPGPTVTPTLERSAAAKGVNIHLDDMASRIPLQRMGMPDDQAEAAVWLCSNHARFITGAQLVVDGGLAAKR